METVSQKFPVLCTIGAIESLLKIIVEYNSDLSCPFIDNYGYKWKNAIPASLKDYEQMFIR